MYDCTEASHRIPKKDLPGGVDYDIKYMYDGTYIIMYQ